MDAKPPQLEAMQSFAREGDTAFFQAMTGWLATSMICRESC
jgi:hypothetical protein